MLDFDAEYRAAYWDSMLRFEGGPVTLADRLEELRPRWMAAAACRGAPIELFFPARGASTRRARAYCERCAVQTECADYAERNREAGVWGRRVQE